MAFGWKRVLDPGTATGMRAIKIWYPDGTPIQMAVDRGLDIPTMTLLANQARIRYRRPGKVYRGEREGSKAAQRRIRQDERKAWKEFDAG